MSASSTLVLKYYKEEHREMLLRHIQANPQKTHWHPGEIYTLGGEPFTVNNLIVRRPRKAGKPQQDRFEVFEYDIFASGSFGKLKQGIANLIIKDGNLLVHKEVELPKGCKRIAKYQNKKLAIDEFSLLKAVSPDEVKPLVIDDAYDMGTVIMTFYHGLTLEQILQADIPGQPGFLTDEQRHAYCVGVLEALIDHVTNKGIIHRDFKPANLILLASGKFKVIDYGLAKQAGYETQEDVGTPLYMSPEQWQWKLFCPTVTSARSDAFAAGVIISEIWRHKRVDNKVVAWITSVRKKEDKPRDFSRLFDNMQCPAQEAGIRELVSGLTKNNPSDRLSAHEALIRIRQLWEPDRSHIPADGRVTPN